MIKEFNSVIGYDDIKIELERIIDMMKSPKKYKELGAKTTRGLLLQGDPGVGKTLMAKCFIKASKRKAFTIRKDLPDGDFVKYIKETFYKAKKEAPSIVFLDDMDKFANSDERYRNTEEFVTIQSCIDDVKDDEVFVLATTNELRCIPYSLLRAGRFDKVIEVENPTGDDAKKIVEHYLSTKKVDKNVDFGAIAKLLDGGSCATLETVINEAGVYAGFDNRETISMDDLIRSFMRVVYAAPEKLEFEDNKYLTMTACHEAGHAVVAEILEPNSVNFISVKPYNSNTNGFTNAKHNKDYFSSKHFMENKVKMLLAGKAAVEVTYGVVDVGCHSDLERAFRITQRFVDDYCGYGFNYFEGICNQEPLGMEEHRYSFVAYELEKYYQEVKKILIDNRLFLNNLTKTLAAKKVLLDNEIQTIKNETLYLID